MKSIFFSLASAVKDIAPPPRVWSPVSSQLYHPHSPSTHRREPAQRWRTWKLVSKQTVSQQTWRELCSFRSGNLTEAKGLNVCHCGCGMWMRSSFSIFPSVFDNRLFSYYWRRHTRALWGCRAINLKSLYKWSCIIRQDNNHRLNFLPQIDPDSVYKFFRCRLFCNQKLAKQT